MTTITLTEAQNGATAFSSRVFGRIYIYIHTYIHCVQDVGPRVQTFLVPGYADLAARVWGLGVQGFYIIIKCINSLTAVSV